jgi:threonine/homoserine efflux transporter RhtA
MTILLILAALILLLPVIRYWRTRWHGVTWRVVYSNGEVVFMSGQLGAIDWQDVVSMEQE